MGLFDKVAKEVRVLPLDVDGKAAPAKRTDGGRQAARAAPDTASTVRRLGELTEDYGKEHELEPIGTLFCHPPTAATQLSSYVVYAPAELFAKRAAGANHICLLVQSKSSGETCWIAGIKRQCACRATTQSPCASFGVSPALWTHVQQVLSSADQSDLLVTEVVRQTQCLPRVTQLTLLVTNKGELSAAEYPSIRTALHGVCLFPKLEGKITKARDGSILKFKVLDFQAEGAKHDASLAIYDRFRVKTLNIQTSPDAMVRGAAEPSRRRGFARVGGMAEVKSLLNKTLLNVLKFPDRHMTAAGEVLGLRPVKGVLLHGVPGTGKSLMCSAIEEELHDWYREHSARGWCTGVVVEKIDASSIKDAYDLRQRFAACVQRFHQSKKLTLLLLDEVDGLCPKRTEATDEPKIAIINCMLTHLDGPNSSWSTFLIATTNRPDALDEALRRPGRIDREVEIPVPTAEDRLAILVESLRRCNAYEPLMAAGVQLEELRELCTRASGFVGSDIDAWVRYAAEEALDDDRNEEIRIDDLRSCVKKVRPSALKELTIEIPHVRWDDIGGYEEIRECLKESVEWPIKYAHVFGELGLKAPRGILLYGPPGNSKTLMAKAVATESHMNFISIRGPEVYSKWVGESEKRIREIFKRARQYAPTVIFFDEIDSLGVDRASSGGTGVETRVLSQMLNEMDGMSAGADVIILGATNRPDILDPALVRPGRFDKLVYVPLPNRAARLAIWAKYLPEELCAGLGAPDDVLNTLADRSKGFSGAEIEGMCNQARMNAARLRINALAGVQKDGSQSENVFDVLSNTKPRTSAESIQYFESFAAKHPR